jgi:hypothetical protein
MTSRNELRDSRNRPLGYIETDLNGKQTIWDSHNARLGSYDPRNNETRDVRNKIIGKGNLLTSLLSGGLEESGMALHLLSFHRTPRRGATTASLKCFSVCRRSLSLGLR